MERCDYGKTKSSVNNRLFKWNRFSHGSLSCRKGIQSLCEHEGFEKKDNLLSAAEKAGVSVEALQLDVTDEKSVKSAVAAIMKKEGKIDVLVNNAGFGSGGFLEDFSMEEIKEQFETNFFGVIRVTQEVLPIMRAQKRGLIVNMSSIGGKIAFPLSTIYAASKFGVEALTESLRVQLSPFGIKVTAIEPPAVQTNFVSSVKTAKLSQSSSSPYYEYTVRYEKKIKEMSRNAASVEPVAVAEVIHKAIISKNPKRSYPIGRARTLLFMKSILLNSTFEWIVGKMFLG